MVSWDPKFRAGVTEGSGEGCRSKVEWENDRRRRSRVEGHVATSKTVSWCRYLPDDVVEQEFWPSGDTGISHDHSERASCGDHREIDPP